MKVLLTAFDPFGGEKVNPALEAIKLVKNNILGAEIVKLMLPTVFNKSIEILDEAIKKESPDIIICVGQAGGRFEVTPERVAINIDDARILDNEGNQPVDKKIFEGGEAAYFSTLPIKAIVAAINAINLPASVSNSAGTFVCNHIMYGLLYLLDKKYSNIIGGFIHVPYIPMQVVDKRNMPYMNLEDITRALEAAIEASVQ